MLTPGIHVFCYHGIADRIVDPVLERNFMPVARFREQIRYFQQFAVISLAQLEDALVAPATNAPRIVITVDDGHVSALQIQEVLADFKMPWTAFISTGVVEQPRLLWPAELALLILRGSCKKVDLLGEQWSLDSRTGRETAYHTMRRHLKRLPCAEKDYWLANLRTQYPSGESLELLEQFPLFRVMTWDDIRRLHQAGVTIGSHGVTHEIHHTAQDQSVREKELRLSKAELEVQVGEPCPYFAFPNGNAHPQSPAELASAGYRLGLTVDTRAVNPGDNPFLLPRENPTSL
jgi:peptidoglycan/xylan/chitin deacetylase (PgdA/CDA1 family)